MILVGNTYELLLDSRGKKEEEDLGNTKQVIMEGRMKEKAPCRLLQKGNFKAKKSLVMMGFKLGSSHSEGRHSDHNTTTTTTAPTIVRFNFANIGI